MGNEWVPEVVEDEKLPFQIVVKGKRITIGKARICEEESMIVVELAPNQLYLTLTEKVEGFFVGEGDEHQYMILGDTEEQYLVVAHVPTLFVMWVSFSNWSEG